MIFNYISAYLYNSASSAKLTYFTSFTNYCRSLPLEDCYIAVITDNIENIPTPMLNNPTSRNK